LHAAAADLASVRWVSEFLASAGVARTARAAIEQVKIAAAVRIEDSPSRRGSFPKRIVVIFGRDRRRAARLLNIWKMRGVRVT
jgi:hypothetical protein